MKLKFLLFLVLLLPVLGFAKAGATIPLPKITIVEAITIAQQRLLTEKSLVDGASWKAEDYLPVSVTYTNRFDGKTSEEWVWVIVFVHPVANDHSVTYKVSTLETIELLRISE